MNSVSRAVIILIALLVNVPANGQQVIVNELYNSSGGDEWMELLVVKDSLDLRSWSIRDFSSAGVAQAPLTFTSDPLWSDVRAGTIIVIARPENSTLGEDTDPSDYQILIKSSNSLYFTGNVFSFAGTSDAVELRNPLTTHVIGVSWGASNASSLSMPKVHFPGSSSSGTSISFNGDSVLYTTDPANWTFNNATKTLGTGNTPTNAAWIARLRLHADGSGTAAVRPDTLDGGQTFPLQVTYHRDPAFSVNALRVILPPNFAWSHASGDVAYTNMTASLTVSGDTLEFSGIGFSADSTTVSIALVTAPDSTAFYPIMVQSRVVSFGTVAPIPRIAVFGTPTAIGNVKVNDANGMPLRAGELVTIRGIVTVAGEFGGPAYLQDNSGGIAVFGSLLSSAAAAGDEIVVSGVVSPFNGLSELISPRVHALLSRGNTVAPLVVTCAQVAGDGSGGIEQFEGMLVRLNAATVTDTSNNPIASWSVSGSGANYRLHDQTGQLDIRVDNNVDFANTVAPAGVFDVVGVVSQFKASLPFIGGYQLMPRSSADILSSGPIISSFPVETNIQPGSLTIVWQTVNPGTSRLRYGTTPACELGLAGDDNPATAHSVPLTGLMPATVYHIKAFSSAGSDTSFASTLIASTASPQATTGAVNVYFNKSVYTALARPTPALGNQDLPARILTRIANARRSVDVALYSLSGTSVGDNIASALVATRSRGVKVRVICEADNRNSNAFNTLAANGVPLISDRFDPVILGAGLMHNKFFVIDGKGGAPESIWVWTGSWNATVPGSADDFQNAIEVQDAALAGAYTIEFEEMWGSSTEVPDPSASRFGARKTDNTPHKFVIGGRPVECYFSPSDRTTSRIISAIGSARHSVAVGTMTLTRSDIASALVARKIGGNTVRVILDNGTDTGSQFGVLLAQGLDVRVKTGPGIFHHKYLLVDSEDPAWDPLVLTGSHNWSSSAENSNNENTLLVHDAPIANQYLQEFAARYYQFGGGDTIRTDVESSEEPVPASFALLQNFPNPFNPATTIEYHLPAGARVALKVYDILGREVAVLANAWQGAGTYRVRFDARNLASGVYLYRVEAGTQGLQKKMILVK